MTETIPEITLYTSNFCGQAWVIENFLSENDIPVKIINIDGDPEARQMVMSLNDGYASVPTLVFADGTKLTEPSLTQLRVKLGLERPSSILVNKVRNLLRQND
jgi:mycoredoxin